MDPGFEGEGAYRVLAVEGSRSRTVAVLADARGQVLGIGRGGPFDPDGVGGGIEPMGTALGEAIEGARASAGDPDLSHILAARLAMSIAPVQAARVVGQLIPYARLVSEGDAPAALASITFGGPGVCVLAGLRSIAFGRCPRGREVTVGGWGYMMGDEGSAYWIAMQALGSMTKAADGRGPATVLTSLLLRHWGAPNLMGLYEKVYAGGLDREILASGAERVGEAAGAGDAVAIRIIHAAGLELALLASTVLRRLDMLEGPATVGMVGGVFRAGAPLMEAFSQSLQSVAPQAEVVQPAVPAVLGALSLALLDIEMPLDDEVVGRLRAAAPQVIAIGN